MPLIWAHFSMSPPGVVAGRYTSGEAADLLGVRESWLRRRATCKWLRRHRLPGWWPTDGATRLFDPMTVLVTRYRDRAANIPTPWRRTSTTMA